MQRNSIKEAILMRRIGLHIGFLDIKRLYPFLTGFPRGSMVRNQPANSGDVGLDPLGQEDPPQEWDKTWSHSRTVSTVGTHCSG